MNVLSVKPGHDGSIAFVGNGRLIFSLEAEKDSFPRYENMTAQLLATALDMAPEMPDVLALGGWHKVMPGYDNHVGAGYFGLRKPAVGEGKVFGKPVVTFSSSHERSHVFMTATMHPDAPMQECVILVWEGRIGAFYHWRDGGTSITRYPVMTEPGNRYGALFALAEPSFPDHGSNPNHEYAGKLMALTAFADDRPLPDEDEVVIEKLLSEDSLFPFDKSRYAGAGLYNIGVTTPRFTRAARALTDRLFDAFHQVAQVRLPQGLPLLVSGGCGLNCEWNQRWRRSAFCSDVFVPPCTNDSGSAIGTAGDVLVTMGEPGRITWSVYAGSTFHHDIEPDLDTWGRRSVNHDHLIDLLIDGTPLPWVQGRCEMGPRALGNRSLLATPLKRSAKELLNRIKDREAYRPIAPCCRAEELGEWFHPAIDDPHMLYFSQVKTAGLPAITHVDGTARVQSVRASTNPQLHALLSRARAKTGYGVLCNTSLNFKGRGFINSMSDLVQYCDDKQLDHFVVGDDWYSRRASHA